MLWCSRGRLGIRNNETPPQNPAVPRRRAGYTFRHADSSTLAVSRLRPLAGTPPPAADQRHSRNTSYGAGERNTSRSRVDSDIERRKTTPTMAIGERSILGELRDFTREILETLANTGFPEDNQSFYPLSPSMDLSARQVYGDANAIAWFKDSSKLVQRWCQDASASIFHYTIVLSLRHCL